MKRETLSGWILLGWWPLLGGIWGAWVMFRGPYSRLSHMNGDSFAPFFVWIFAILFALLGLIAGAALCALVGGMVEWLRRRFELFIGAAVAVATLINVLALWQAADLVQEKYPGFRVEMNGVKPQGGASRNGA